MQRPELFTAKPSKAASTTRCVYSGPGAATSLRGRNIWHATAAAKVVTDGRQTKRMPAHCTAPLTQDPADWSAVCQPQQHRGSVRQADQPAAGGSHKVWHTHIESLYAGAGPHWRSDKDTQSQAACTAAVARKHQNKHPDRHSARADAVWMGRVSYYTGWAGWRSGWYAGTTHMGSCLAAPTQCKAEFVWYTGTTRCRCGRAFTVRRVRCAFRPPGGMRSQHQR